MSSRTMNMDEELHAWLAAPHAAAGGPAEAGADDVDMYVVGFQASSAVVCRERSVR